MGGNALHCLINENREKSDNPLFGATSRRRLFLEKKRLRGVISRVVKKVEEATSRRAVKCVLNELESQYAKACRAQVALEDAPDEDELEAAHEKWWSLAEELSTTRVTATTFLDGKESYET
ncbi:hypothetical protein T4E_6709 [Trichinella pseudospiralis]|uniref:Uncharacterized protein n=1 Tax=Trichinella pseudospiralis TaxID=6337 RepID=A0A0V0XIY0_TRIPS|nr:hypothetical protein T4E_6709 [Trichinella pseudospiralis]